METLPLLVVCFLLLSTTFVAVQTAFADINCNENIHAEIGKDINITCINNEKIKNIAVKFCTNLTLCSDSNYIINTYENKFTADNGRITLEININSVILHISCVQISDQRMYHFFFECSNGIREQDVTLNVVSTGQVEHSLLRLSPAAPVPSESEQDALERFISNDAIPKEAQYSVSILALIVLLAFVFSVALYWRKKKEIKFYREFHMNNKDEISQ